MKITTHQKLVISLALGAILLALSCSAEAQQAGNVRRIGFLSSSGNPFAVEAFRKGLRELGYIEGKNILIEYRSAEAKLDRIPGLIAELVQLKVDVLVSTSQPAIRTAKQAAKTIPIVMIANFDPVETGIIDSLAHPGANITGVSTLARELNGKRLELLKEAIPGILRVALLLDSSTAVSRNSLKEYEAAARDLKLPLQPLEVRAPKPDFESAFQAAAKGRVSALVTVRDAVFHRYQKQIADLAIKHRLPSMYERSDYVEAGGLVSYSSDDAENYRRAAAYVDKIFKGTKPGEIPVEQPTKFELVINLNTAKQIGLTIPPNVLARADKVIK